MRVRLALLLLVAAGSGCGQRVVDSPAREKTAEHPRLALVPDRDSTAVTSVDVLGLTAGQRAAFERLDHEARVAALQVHVASSTSDLPAVVGTAEVAGEAIRFIPRYPFAPGMSYRLEINPGVLDDTVAGVYEPVSLEFSIPRAEAPPTKITHVYPTTDRLAENHLKFYIHFSAPMSRGEAYRHVHLLDADQRELQAVFLELGEELWDPAMQRFTLLFDPGRVKRGLVPREELGAVLQAGRDYTLVIDGNWPDAHGQPLVAGQRKSFHVIEPDETPIDVATWKVTPPAGSQKALVVEFPEPLDHALLLRLLRVLGPEGKPLTGKADVTAGETGWQFVPERDWSAGTYQLVVETTLEDLAGNAIGRAFDVDTFAPIGKTIAGDTISRPFVVEAPR